MSLLQLKLQKFLRLKRYSIWVLLTGLSAGLLFLMTALINPAQAQSLVPTGTDAYYTLQPGEGLPEVALRFGLDVRTVRCANPSWKPGQSQVAVPLTSAIRYPLSANSNPTLAEIARAYQVDIEVITGFPLNYWEGCPGEPGMGGKQPNARPAAGSLLYIPTVPAIDSLPKVAANSRTNPAALPGGSQAQVDPYMAEEDPQEALVNPYPLPFKLNEITFNTTPGANSRPIRPAEGVIPEKPTATPTATATPNKPVATSTPKPAVTSPTATPTAVPPTQPVTTVANTGTPLPAAGKPLIWPIRGVITTYFSSAHPGVDIATKAGTPVLAAQSGRVYYAAWSPYGYGNFVQIDHGDGRQTHYAHLISFAVQTGQQVSQGQVIGYEGSTGNSTGPHLHFELVISGHYVNPLQYLGS